MVVEDIYEASPIQSGLYFHLLLEPGSGVYVEQLAFTLQGDLDVAAFRRSWQLVVARHPILRTSFHWHEAGKVLQVVHSDVTLDVPVHDWSAEPADVQEARFAATALAERIRGFDLTRPPLMRVELTRLEPQRYRLFWTFPHLVLDGWSFGLVFAEFAAAYAAFAQGETPALPPPRPYRDYVAWNKRQNPQQEAHFWQEYLAGYVPPRPFSVGPPQPCPAGQPTQDVMLDHGLREVVPRVSDLARAHGLTLNTVMQGAWAVVLGRYLGVDDVVAGATSSHRPAGLPGADLMVGPMLSTIPIRAQLDPAQDLIPWLHRLQESMATAREHASVTLSDLRPLLGLSGDAELFDTDVAFENVPVPEMRLHGLEIVETWYDGRPHYPVTMVLVPGEGLTPRVVYDRRRLPAQAARRLLGHFHTVLAGIAGNPGRRLGELTVLAPAERAELVASGAPPLSAQPRCLHDVFTGHAARAPDAVAVTDSDRSLTYAELDAQANRLAHRLRELGAGPGVRVGLCLGRTLDCVVAILGVLKSGAGYVPLDLGYPAERMAYILSDAQASILVTHAAADAVRPEFAGAVVDLDRDAAELAALPGGEPGQAGPADAGPGRRPGPDDLAYIIYTSGSTGRPKGVLVSHGNVAAMLAGISERFSLSAADTWSMFHSCTFDFSVFEMWGALWHGGRVVVVPREVVLSPEEMYRLLCREQVTVFSQTPSAFRQFMLATLAGADADGPAEQSPGLALRYVVFGGEYLDVPALRPWFDRYGDSSPVLVNMYGITETTVHVTFAAIDKQDLDSPVRSRVGRPLPGVTVYLLDHHGEPVPAGVPGEMYVSGATVASGYQGRPELTEQRFLPSPFSVGDGVRMYRSGDLARRLDDGELEILGRVDDQLKVRGYRVEPGEVEAVLRQDEAVQDAVVVARSTLDGQLVGYLVVKDPHPEAVVDRLRRQVRTQLPDFMVPAHLVTLDRLPLTANGKLDRAALPEPDGGRAAASAEYVAPTTPLQHSIAAVWQEALAVSQVGIHDDFFALGGHSLLAVQAAFRLRTELGRDVPVRALFDHPTVAALAEHLPDQQEAATLRPRARVRYQEQGSEAS